MNQASSFQFRSMDPNKDVDALLRLYRHAGWVSGAKKELHADDSRNKEVVSCFCKEAQGYVACYDGQIESYAQTHAGTIMQTDTILPLCAVTAVISSYVLRKQKATSYLLAKALAERAQAGDAIAMLGVFDQGYYDRLGFGTNSYEIEFSIDPRNLAVEGSLRPPKEFSIDDVERIYHSRRNAHRIHGTCTVDSPVSLRGEMLYSDEKNAFVLGYTNQAGEITHHFFGSFEGEHGPGAIHWMVYQTQDQFFELLRLLKALSDQFYNFWMLQPPHVQLQDFLREPFRSVEITKEGKLPAKTEAYGFSQLRILNLEKTLAATHLHGPSVSFNVRLEDPIHSMLPEDASWRGLGGEYTVDLGPESRLRPGLDRSYETVDMSVNEFSRLIHASISPLKLAFMGKLRASETLVSELSRVLHLPEPHPQWLF